MVCSSFELHIDTSTNTTPARTTYAIEAPASEREVVERRETIIQEPAEVPRSVREWDAMSGTLGGGGKSEHGGGGHSVHGSVHGSVARSHKSKHSNHRSRSEHRSSHHGRHSSHGGSTVRGHSRSPSPIVIVRNRSKSRRRSHSSAGHNKVDAVEEEEFGESNSMHPGPLALVMPHREKRSNSRDERRIKDEIRELEAEKRRLKRERHEKKHYHRGDDEDEVVIERVHSSGHGREKEVKIEKDRKGNMAFVK